MNSTEPCRKPRMCVEVVYAEPQRAISKIYRVKAGASAGDVLRLAAADGEFVGVAVLQSRFGIYGKAAKTDEPLQDGDRIEIYRPLLADPKQMRRARAKQASRSGRS